MTFVLLIIIFKKIVFILLLLVSLKKQLNCLTTGENEMVNDDSLKRNKKISKNDLDEIRDIIFGDDKEVWENQINLLKQECNDLQNKLSALEKKLEETEKTLSNNVDELKISQSQQQKLNEVIENLKNEFEFKIKELTESKVDKKQIGQAFIEWGTKVKQKTN